MTTKLGGSIVLGLWLVACRLPLEPTDIVGGESAAASSFAHVVGLTSPRDYDRDEWMPGGRWADADGDCQDTRAEVLIEESFEAVSFSDARACRVVAGLWRDEYSGSVYRDARILDIDHLVPLAEAHASGGWAWAPSAKAAYANDLASPDHLVAVHRSLNRQKGARTPADWRPPSRRAWCAYAAAWRAIKERYGLALGAAERLALDEMRSGCFVKRNVYNERAEE